MDYLGLILFLWILGGTGVFMSWLDRLLRNDRSDVLFRPSPHGWERDRADAR